MTTISVSPVPAPRQLRDYQVEAADAVCEAWNRGVEAPAVVLPTGSGKAQPSDTIVPTPDGFRRFGDLAVGDEVFGRDGTANKVSAISEQGERNILRLTFEDGAETLVVEDHLWLLLDAATGDENVYATRDVAPHLTMPDGSPRWSVPLCDPVKFVESGTLPVDPMVHGQEIRSGDASDSMYILAQFLTASVDDRREVLDGIMGKRNTLPRSAGDFALSAAASLIRSLGGVPEWHQSRGSWSMRARWGGRRALISVEEVGTAEARCITVERQDGLYITGADFVVTHNSTVIAEVTSRAVRSGWPVLLLAHRSELIEQMADAVMAVNPTGPVPAKIGGDHREDPRAQIVSCTVQSLYNDAALERLGDRRLIIVDEAHHAVASTYTRVLDHFINRGALRAGFTATMMRHADGKDSPELRTVWHEVVFERDIVWAIDNGFLLRPDGVTVDLEGLDTSTFRTAKDGDYSKDDVEAAMMSTATLNATVQAVLEYSAGKQTIIFGASTAHCVELAALLVTAGISAETVSAKTSAKERKGIYKRFRSGQTQALVTVDVLTEGADFPMCEVVVLAKPTKSQIRYIQCVGRALRLHTYADGTTKDRALLVDLVGAGKALGLIAITKLDRDQDAEDEDGISGCPCQQPCSGQCTLGCTGEDCDCVCACVPDEVSEGSKPPEVSDIPCTCTCSTIAGLCRCGCECDLHRVDPLTTFDPVTGEVTQDTKKLRKTDTQWSVRTSSIRWTKHPHGLVRPVYRSGPPEHARQGALVLADLRGVAGVVPGMDWAFGFYDSRTRIMRWLCTDGQWHTPAPDVYLAGMSLEDADTLANNLFPGHLRDHARKTPSDAMVMRALSLGIGDARDMDMRDLADLISFMQVDRFIPRFARAEEPSALASV